MSIHNKNLITAFCWIKPNLYLQWDKLLHWHGCSSQIQNFIAYVCIESKVLMFAFSLLLTFCWLFLPHKQWVSIAGAYFKIYVKLLPKLHEDSFGWLTEARWVFKILRHSDSNLIGFGHGNSCGETEHIHCSWFPQWILPPMVTWSYLLYADDLFTKKHTIINVLLK